MKLTILFVVVVGAILVWWLRSVKFKGLGFDPALRRRGSMPHALHFCDRKGREISPDTMTKDIEPEALSTLICVGRHTRNPPLSQNRTKFQFHHFVVTGDGCH